MIQGNIYSIMIGCPGDMLDEAKIVMECINRWNVIHSASKRISLIPIHWTSASYPSLDNEGQKELNRQLCERSDALICLFGSRLGSPTSTHISGTVEEIEEHIKAGKPVMVFFKKLVDSSRDPENYIKLLEYKTTLAAVGLYFDFNQTEDFKSLFMEKLDLLVHDKFESMSATIGVPITKTIYSDEERVIMKEWCQSNNDRFSIMSFIGGKSMFRFGNIRVETETAREKAQYEDLVLRLEKDGYIIKDKLNKQNHWTYKLTFQAFDKFDV